MRLFRFFLLFALCVPFADSASAQLFGPRSAGRNSTRRAISRTLEITGTLDEAPTITRQERSATDFVGSDSREVSGFVGSTQASTATSVTSAVEGLPEETSPFVNRALAKPPFGIYPARLSIAFDVPVNSPHGATPERSSRQVQSLAQKLGFRIQRNRDQRSAVITGTVATDHERQIAGLLVLFEPGVETVTNEVQVQSLRSNQP